MKGTSPFIVFIHIEKAAGTTLHDFFYRNILGYTVLSPGPHDTFLKKGELSEIKKKYPILKGCGGHSTRSYVDYDSVIDNIFYITFLRNPIRRFASHYLYQKEVMLKKQSWDEFIKCDKYSNFMCKRICGYPDHTKAINELKKFFHVGITEFFDISLLGFKEKMIKNGVRINVSQSSYNIKNVRSGKKKEKQAIDDSLRKKIESVNVEDIKLYDYFYNKMSLYAKEKDHFCEKSSPGNTLRQSLILFSNKTVRYIYIKQLERYLFDKYR